MQLIYERISGGEGGEDSLQMIYEQLREETAQEEHPVGEAEPRSKDRAYIQLLLEGVLSHLEEIDGRIAAVSQGWALDRMARVDLTILRLATFELLYEEDVPGSVVVNEAINLARRYSEPNSARFINGILGTILREAESGDA